MNSRDSMTTMANTISMMEERLILVDPMDNEIGSGDKYTVHREGLLHRAFSVFIFDSEKRLLLQKRADKKYHSAGLWSNTCCGHPRPGEDTAAAAKRRLFEEMGIRGTELFHLFSFKYKTSFDNGFTEHELDHVFVGQSNTAPLINSEEVSDFNYLGLTEIAEQLKKDPAAFTFWFRLIFDEVRKKTNFEKWVC